MNSVQKRINKRHSESALNKGLARFYNLQSILGNDWAIFRIILGGRMTGKSYSVTERMCKLKRKLGDDVKCYWMRISDTSTKALLCNKADKLVDPDLKRKYELELTTKGNTVYNRGKTFCEVYPLSSFGKMKGVGFYDKDFKGKYFIVLDEWMLEQGEKRTSFDILYNFIGMCENFLRTTKQNVEVWLLGNTLEEASTILKAFNFIPDGFGRFKLKSKRCVIDYIKPNEEYIKRRKGTMADILMPNASTFTNEVELDRSLLCNKRLCQVPMYIIKFKKSKDTWFTLWNNNIIKQYNREEKPAIPMTRYLDEVYNQELMNSVYERFDARAFRFTNLATFKRFQKQLRLLKKK